MRKRNYVQRILIILLVAAPLSLYHWTAAAEKTAHATPLAKQVDLTDILNKESLTEQDYETLFCQTGLARAGIEELIKEDKKEEILYLQKRYFAPVEYECSPCYFLYCSERLVNCGETQEKERWFLPTVRDGDILISFSGHFLGWRSGHAAMVTDAEEGITLEAMDIHRNSQACFLTHWREYPNFAVLRLRNTTDEERAKIAAYAKKELVNIPYALTSFCRRDPDNSEPVTGTQCAHLVWTAFYHFGYDTDSDGGRLVTPYDIYRSNLLELVQVYGINPEE